MLPGLRLCRIRTPNFDNTKQKCHEDNLDTACLTSTQRRGESGTIADANHHYQPFENYRGSRWQIF